MLLGGSKNNVCRWGYGFVVGSKVNGGVHVGNINGDIYYSNGGIYGDNGSGDIQWDNGSGVDCGNGRIHCSNESDNVHGINVEVIFIVMIIMVFLVVRAVVVVLVLLAAVKVMM